MEIIAALLWRIGARDDRQFIYAFQRYETEQQRYVYTRTGRFTVAWQPYVKHYTANLGFDYGGRAAALWLDREITPSYPVLFEGGSA